MPSKKFDSIVEDFNKAVKTYLDERGVKKLDELPLKNRAAQINVIQRVIDSLRGAKNDAKKLTAFIHVLAETISVTPLIGSSVLKNNIQACALKHIPSNPEDETKDTILKAKFFISFFNFLRENPKTVSSWFKGHNDIGKSFNNKFFELLSTSVLKSYEVQKKQINLLFESNNSVYRDASMETKSKPKKDTVKFFESNTKVCRHSSWATRTAKSQDDTVRCYDQKTSTL